MSTGGSGSSTIIQYDKAGNVQFTYDIAGSVDGLKFNPYTGKVWALQNQDGNSTLSLIDPKTHSITGPIAYANTSATRGFDDVVFEGNKVFLSYTNPSTDTNPNNAPTVVELSRRTSCSTSSSARPVLVFALRRRRRSRVPAT